MDRYLFIKVVFVVYDGFMITFVGLHYNIAPYSTFDNVRILLWIAMYVFMNVKLLFLFSILQVNI